MIRFLIKGLVRDRSRSLFPVLMVCAGAFLTVCTYGVMKGTISDMVDSSARFETGHVKIMTRAFREISDQMPNDLALLEVGALKEKLADERPNMTWVPRIRFAGILDVPDGQGQTLAQGPVLGMGVELLNGPGRETEILNLKKSLVRGRLPARPGEVLLSDDFARNLNLVLGGTATLLGSTMNGAMTTYNFKVVGTLKFGIAALDRSFMIADLNDVRAALDMADGASEILGFAKTMVYADRAMTGLAREFNNQYSDPKDEFSPTMLSLGQEGQMEEILRMSNAVGSIIVAIFVLAMSVVLWNAGLMDGLRRYGEIGVRLAVGESKGALYRSMILESICTGIAGSVLGTALGLVLSYWLQQKGFDITSIMQKSTVMVSSVVRARVTPTSYYIGFLPGLLASVLGTMVAGIGIFRRQTAQLFRELET